MKLINTENFDKAYKTLNKAQKEAVDSIEGPVMVIAGPGTGKTQILTLRIANILRITDTRPENILAITFTEAGANAMRKRLLSIIGEDAYKVVIQTFHGFSNNLITDFPEYFEKIIGRSPANEIDVINIIEKIIDSNDFKIIKPYGDKYYYVKSIRSSIKSLKQEACDVETFEQFIKSKEDELINSNDKYHEKGPHKGKVKASYLESEKNINKNKELLVVYRSYEDELSKSKLYDFEDMLLESYKALRDKKDLLLTLQENYQYILADEHQDANRAQNKILELLINFHRDPNIFIVGDEKQAIFRFQGASLQNFHYFKNLYPTSKVIALSDNYRSHQGILDTASIISSLVTDNDIKLISKVEENKNINPINICEFYKADDEVNFVVNKIKEFEGDGINLNDIAILARDNKDANSISESLNRDGIKNILSSERDILKSIHIQKFVTLLKAIDNPNRADYLGESLFLDFFKLPIVSIYKILKSTNDKRMSLFDILTNENVLLEVVGDDTPFFKKWIDDILRWSALSKNDILPEVLSTVAEESLYMQSILEKEDSLNVLALADTLYSEMRKLVESNNKAMLGDFLTHIDKMIEYNVPLNSNINFEKKNAVNVMTAHKSKGLEFKKVFIIGVNHGKWGGKRDRKMFDLPEYENRGGDDDERRLFYVSITRAKEEVYVCYSKYSLDGKELLPSVFVTEIDTPLCNKLTVSGNSKKTLLQSSSKSSGMGTSIFDIEYLRSEFLKSGLSVTSLNNYLNCPSTYFFMNLIRLPKAMTRDQVYGVAVHNALRELFEGIKNGEEASRSMFIASFEKFLSREALSEGDFKDSLSRGKKSLSGYFDTYSGAFSKKVINEKRISGVSISFKALNEEFVLPLKGTLDKIEIMEDGKSINVVDYKTSKPKSRNALEGNTQFSTGNEKRQLVFYKLLCDSYFNDLYTFISGEIDFVEPDDKGVYKKELFVIDSNEVDELRKLINRVSLEIYNGDFLNNRCEEKDCKYCRMMDGIIK